MNTRSGTVMNRDPTQSSYKIKRKASAKPKRNSKTSANKIITSNKVKKRSSSYDDESDSMDSDDAWAEELETISVIREEPRLSSLDGKSIVKFLEDAQYFARSHVKLIDYISMEALEMLSIMSEINLLVLMKLKNEELCEFLRVYNTYHVREVDLQMKAFPMQVHNNLPKDMQLLHMNMPKGHETFVSKLEEYYSEFSKELKHPVNKDLYTRHELKKMFTSGLALDDLRSEANRIYFEDFQEIFGWAYNKMIALDRRKLTQPLSAPAESIAKERKPLYSTEQEKAPPKNTYNYRFNQNQNAADNRGEYKAANKGGKYATTKNEYNQNHVMGSCGKYGDYDSMQRKAPADVRCNKCSKFGHYGYECTDSLSSTSSGVVGSSTAKRMSLENEHERQKKFVRFEKPALERMLVRG